MNIKYAIIYSYDRTGRLKNDSTAAVMIRAYLNGKNKFFNTKVYIAPTQWDKRNQRVKNHPNHFYLNQKIRDQLQVMEAYEFEVIRREGAIALDRLADYDKDNLDISFTEFYKQQLDRANLARESFTDQRQTLVKFQSFKPVVYFSELTYKLIKNFDSYLFSSGLGVNIVAKHHKNLKKFINQGIQFNYLDINNHPYKKFKVKREPTERIYLTEFELTQFENIKISKEKEHWEMVKDFFLFCCYTGLRYSDASKITAENLNVTTDGIELYLKAQKTKKPLLVNLQKLFGGKPHDLIKRYLDKYDDFYYDDPDKPMPIFFGLTNQYINRELKKLVADIDIRGAVKQNLSIHGARHTFGTIMSGKVPIAVLQQLMQHSKIKETMIYVHMNQQMINSVLDKIEW